MNVIAAAIQLTDQVTQLVGQVQQLQQERDAAVRGRDAAETRVRQLQQENEQLRRERDEARAGKETSAEENSETDEWDARRQLLNGASQALAKQAETQAAYSKRLGMFGSGTSREAKRQNTAATRAMGLTTTSMRSTQVMGKSNLSDAQVAFIDSAILTLHKRLKGKDYPVPVEELQSTLEGQGYQISEAELIQFLQFCHGNYDKPAFLGKLPAVMYLEADKSFMVCV